MNKIASITARPILDSRGEWTIEVTMSTDSNLSVSASVPQGKSKGSHEAVSLEAHIAVCKIQKTIVPKLDNLDLISQEEFDKILIDLDGTEQKSNLGANSLLALSLAYARLKALQNNLYLWQYLRGLVGSPEKVESKLRLLINVINGGLHSGSNLHFQEYHIIPKSNNLSEAIKLGTTIYHSLKDYLEKNKGKQATNVGDEGGFAGQFIDDLEPFDILEIVSNQLNLREKIEFGLDAAGTDVGIGPAELKPIYEKLITYYQLKYLEDPFDEENFADFKELTKLYGTQTKIVGDDLTTTNLKRMEQSYQEGSINGIIIKPNQIGTLSETLQAIKQAKSWGYFIVVSHRSGETEDDFIADLAYGTRVGGIKIGAPDRGERVAKYNRLLEIEIENNNSST